MSRKRIFLIALIGLLLHGNLTCGSGSRDLVGSSTGIRGEWLAVAVAVVGVTAFLAGVNWANKGAESKSSQIDRAVRYRESLNWHKYVQDQKQIRINELEDSLEAEKQKVQDLESANVILQACLDGHQVVRSENTYLKRQLQLHQNMQRNLKGVFGVGFYTGIFYRTKILKAK